MKTDIEIAQGNTGPREGSRRHKSTFLSNLLSASARPTLVVVLPSPAGVGLMAVTRMSFPFRGQLRRGVVSILAFTPAAQHCGRTGGTDAGCAQGGRLRYHRGLRDHGGAVPGLRFEGFESVTT